MISRFKKWSGVLISTLLFAGATVAGEMPFPPIENGKVKLVVSQLDNSERDVLGASVLAWQVKEYSLFV